MPGGELQLQYKGGQDLFLTNNPQISFFKSVYKKYTNFSMEVIEIDLNTNDNKIFSSDGLSERVITFKIPRNGDLLHTVYLNVDIPDVFSQRTEQFCWIRRLGEYLIKSISIVGGDSRVYNRITSEYLHVYAETHLTKDKIDAYNEMIGNVPEMYDPANSKTNNGIYPAYDSTSEVPSIRGRKLTIPIPFWFCLTSGTALPLIALQQMDFRIDVTLRLTKELYTIINPATTPIASEKFSASTFGKRIRPADSHVSTFSNNNSSSKIEMYGNYIFLDVEERKRFALSEHKYLMKQYQYVEETMDESTVNNIDLLNLTQLTNQMFILVRFVHNENVNQWSNFTVWEHGPSNELESPCNPNFVSQFVESHYPNLKSNPSPYKDPNIISNLQLKINGNNRNNVSNIEIFKYINSYVFNKTNSSVNGIYSYSFGIDNTKFQPSGSINFSVIPNKELLLTRRSNLSGQIKVIVISENINFFRLIGGMANVEFEY